MPHPTALLPWGYQVKLPLPIELLQGLLHPSSHGHILQRDQPIGNKNPLPSRLCDPRKLLSFSDILYKSKQIKTSLIRLARSKGLAARKKAQGVALCKELAPAPPAEKARWGMGVWSPHPCQFRWFEWGAVPHRG